MKSVWVGILSNCMLNGKQVIFPEKLYAPVQGYTTNIVRQFCIVLLEQG